MSAMQFSPNSELKIKAPWGNISLISCGNPRASPVLLVHGREDCATTFQPLMEHLPAEEFYYVSINMPGSGNSDPLPNETRTKTSVNNDNNFDINEKPLNVEDYEVALILANPIPDLNTYLETSTAISSVESETITIDSEMYETIVRPKAIYANEMTINNEFVVIQIEDDYIEKECMNILRTDTKHVEADFNDNLPANMQPNAVIPIDYDINVSNTHQDDDWPDVIVDDVYMEKLNVENELRLKMKESCEPLAPEFECVFEKLCVQNKTNSSRRRRKGFGGKLIEEIICNDHRGRLCPFASKAFVQSHLAVAEKRSFTYFKRYSIYHPKIYRLRRMSWKVDFALTYKRYKISKKYMQSPAVNVTTPFINEHTPVLYLQSPAENEQSPVVYSESQAENEHSSFINVESQPVNVLSPAVNMQSPPVNVQSSIENKTETTAPSSNDCKLPMCPHMPPRLIEWLHEFFKNKKIEEMSQHEKYNQVINTISEVVQTQQLVPQMAEDCFPEFNLNSALTESVSSIPEKLASISEKFRLPEQLTPIGSSPYKDDNSLSTVNDIDENSDNYIDPPDQFNNLDVINEGIASEKLIGPIGSTAGCIGETNYRTLHNERDRLESSLETQGNSGWRDQLVLIEAALGPLSNKAQVVSSADKTGPLAILCDEKYFIENDLISPPPPGVQDSGGITNFGIIGQKRPTVVDSLLLMCYNQNCPDNNIFKESSTLDLWSIGVMIMRFHFVACIEATVLHFGWKKFIFVGHSMGGEIGLFYNSVKPDRISKFILLDPEPTFRRLQTSNLAEYQPKFYDAYYSEYWKINYYFRTYTKPQAVKALMRARNLTEEKASIIVNSSLKHVKDDQYRFTWDRRLKMPAPQYYPNKYYFELFKTIPQTLIISAFDSINANSPGSTELLNMLCKLKNVEHIIVEGGHDVHLSNPERFAPNLVNFLIDKNVVLSKL